MEDKWVKHFISFLETLHPYPYHKDSSSRYQNSYGDICPRCQTIYNTKNDAIYRQVLNCKSIDICYQLLPLINIQRRSKNISKTATKIESIDKLTCALRVSKYGLCDKLSKHPDLTLDIIVKYRYRWWWKHLSKHPNLELSWLLSFPDYFDKYYSNLLSIHPNFKIDWVKVLPDKDWDFSTRGLSSHPNLDISWLLAFPNKDWSFRHIQIHPNFKLEWIDQFPYIIKFSGNNSVSQNLNLQLDWLLKYPEADWSWCYDVPKHPNFQFEWVSSFPDKNWNWDIVSHHPDFNWSWVEKMPLKPWALKHVCKHPNVMLDDIVKLIKMKPDLIDMISIKICWNPNFEISWLDKLPKLDSVSWNSLSRHPNLEMDWISKFPEKPWNWQRIAVNPNLKISWMKQYPDVQWDFKHLASLDIIDIFVIKTYLDQFKKYPEILATNPGVTFVWIQLIPEIADHEITHGFQAEKQMFYEYKVAVDKIEAWFLEIKHNPKYGYCQRLLEKTYLEIQGDNC